MDTSECVVFTIFDSYGDGIFAPGGYWLSYGGVQVASGGQNYDFEDRVELNCPPGFSCANPELVGKGTTRHRLGYLVQLRACAERHVPGEHLYRQHL